MRRFVVVMSVVLVGVVGSAVEGKPGNPSASTLATWIRTGTDAQLRQAAEAAAGLSPKALLRVFREVRDWTRIHAKLAGQPVASLSWKGVFLDDAVDDLRDMTDLNFFVSPAARKAKGVTITLSMKKTNVKTVLDLITEPHGLAWTIRGGVVRIDTAAALTPAAGPSPEDVQLRAKIEAETVRVKMPRCEWDEAIREIRRQTGYAVTVDDRIKDSLYMFVDKIDVRDKMGKVLDFLCIFAGLEDATWIVRGGQVVITHKKYVLK